MAILHLNKLWINLRNTGDAIAGEHSRDNSQEFTLASLEMRTYANGRRRAISTVGEVGTIPYTLVRVDLATKDKLRTWKGLSVQVRDNRGQKWFGVFGGIAVKEYMRTDLYIVTFTLLLDSSGEGV